MSFQRNSLAVRGFAAAMRLSNAMQSLPNRIVPAPFRLMQIGSAFWQSRVLYLAARLDLATVLGDRELATADLAAAVKAETRPLHRLLRMLAAMGVFEESSHGHWRNTALSHPLRTDRADSVRAVILMHNAPEMVRPWIEQLEQGIRSGAVPFELTHGQDFYGYMGGNAEFDTLFADAMERIEALAGTAFATDFAWGRFQRLFDIGGSKGPKAVAILKRHPQLQAVVVDRQQVIAEAREYWQSRDAADVLPRMRFEEGDVLASVPHAAGPGDVYLLSAVLHGFDDDTAATALSTVAKAAAPAGATIVILELVVPEDRPDLTAASFDMQMLMATRGGERTAKQWQTLFHRSGVTLVETVGLTSFGKMMVLRPEN